MITEFKNLGWKENATNNSKIKCFSFDGFNYNGEFIAYSNFTINEWTIYKIENNNSKILLTPIGIQIKSKEELIVVMLENKIDKNLSRQILINKIYESEGND